MSLVQEPWCYFKRVFRFYRNSKVLIESAGRAFSMLVSNLYKKVNVTWSTYSKMYKSKLVPFMDYCSSVWGFKPDTIHNRIIKFFLGVNKYTSTPVIHGDVGWDSPLIRRKVNMLGLWKRLICMDNTRLTKQIFYGITLIVKLIGHTK